MEKILEFIKWIGEAFGYGSMILIIVLLVLVGFVYYGLFKNPKNMESFIHWLTKRTHKITKDKLKKHPIFNKKVIYAYRANSIVFAGKYYKTKLFQLFFVTKVTTDIKLLKFFLNNNFKKISMYKLQTLMEEAVTDMVEEFNDVIKQKLTIFSEGQISPFRKDYTREELNIFVEKLYNYIMYEQGGYDEKRQKRLDRIFTHISDIPPNPIYDNNFERVYHFLDILNAVLDTVIIDAVKVYENFNGQIDSMFENFIAGHSYQKVN